MCWQGKVTALESMSQEVSKQAASKVRTLYFGQPFCPVLARELRYRVNRIAIG